MNPIINFVFSIPAALVVALDSISPNKGRILKDKPLKLRPLKWDYLPNELDNLIGNLSKNSNSSSYLAALSFLYFVFVLFFCVFTITILLLKGLALYLIFFLLLSYKDSLLLIIRAIPKIPGLILNQEKNDKPE